MTPLWFVLILLILGQVPVFLAYERLKSIAGEIRANFLAALRFASLSCHLAAKRIAARNTEVILTEDEMKNRHNLQRRFGRLRDAHIRNLAHLPDYLWKVDNVVLTLHGREDPPIRLLAELADLTRRLEHGADKVLQQGLKLDQWIKRQNFDERKVENILSASLYRTLIATTLTMAIAVAAVFVNFNLIALPMGELVPADQLVGGISVAEISAAVIVMLELVVGIFLLESLGITTMFGFDTLAPWQVRVIGVVAFLGLFFLAATEGTLAVMREQIVAADAALKVDIAGGESVMHRSLLPMYGQAVLGFSLPWIIAMVAIPLELAVEASRQLLGRALVLFLTGIGMLFQFSRHLVRLAGTVLTVVLEIYTAVPRSISRLRWFR